jgi:hypothetical protein
VPSSIPATGSFLSLCAVIGLTVNHLQVNLSVKHHGLVFEFLIPMRALYDQIVMLLSTPLYVMVIGAELLISHLDGIKAYSWKDTCQNFFLSLLTGLTDLAMRGVSLLVLTFFFSVGFFHWPHSIA